MTTNAEKYHFEDFTRINYRKLLRLAKSKYIFRNYSDFRKDEKFVLWRHDIDYSVHSALAIAKIEAEESISSTYFIHLHNEFYNALEKEITELIKQIKTLGHSIGLHFDTHYYSIISKDELEKFLSKEKLLLEELLDVPINVFSFHNTTELILGFKNESYSGMINTYSAYFQDEVGYVSDSNGYWRHRRLEDVLIKAEDSCLQILTHAEMWQDEPMPPRQRIIRCIEGRASKNKERYDVLLKYFNRENIDWE